MRATPQRARESTRFGIPELHTGLPYSSDKTGQNPRWGGQILHSDAPALPNLEVYIYLGRLQNIDSVSCSVKILACHLTLDG